MLEAQTQKLIDTGVRMMIPDGYYGHICSKSSLAVKHNIHVGAGIIDSDYRGNIRVLLMNHSKTSHQIVIGDAIAQMIMKKYETFEFEFCQIENFKDTQRGCKGFGEMTKDVYK